MSSALVVVDVQNDFCEGGALAVQGGAAVAAAISAFLREHHDRYAVVVATRDWHHPLPDTNDGHFAVGAAPDYVTTWPVHCVAGTPGAELHPDLEVPDGALHVLKGEGRQDYSGFTGRVLAAGSPVDAPGGEPLGAALEAAGVDRVDVVGLATDHCVQATALDATVEGLRVRVLADLTAGVAVPTTIAALTRLARGGVELTTAADAW